MARAPVISWRHRLRQGRAVDDALAYDRCSTRSRWQMGDSRRSLRDCARSAARERPRRTRCQAGVACGREVALAEPATAGRHAARRRVLDGSHRLGGRRRRHDHAHRRRRRHMVAAVAPRADDDLPRPHRRVLRLAVGGLGPERRREPVPDGRRRQDLVGGMERCDRLDLGAGLRRCGQRLDRGFGRRDRAFDGRRARPGDLRPRG